MMITPFKKTREAYKRIRAGRVARWLVLATRCTLCLGCVCVALVSVSYSAARSGVAWVATTEGLTRKAARS